MEKIEYQQVGEVAYHEKLANGLQVTVIPKKGFRKTYALFTTNYGSIDNEFIPIGLDTYTRVPDGVAHFLEHKMFEKKDGDVFQLFGQLGASANAFTSFTKTSYLFSTTANIYENLEVLLNFVQDPYFTDETVNKEKGIIAQEIKMYEDDPDWQLTFGVLRNLFPTHPLHIDIAGTVESIQDITPEDLYLCYDTFYHPSNMKLLVVGNVDPEMTVEFIRENQAQKDFIDMPPVNRRYPVENEGAIIHESRMQMDIAQPKVMVGGRYFGWLPEDGYKRRQFRFAAQFGLALLFGNTSRNYSEWYQSGLIDDSFSYEFNLERDLCYFAIGGDTNNPDQLVQQIEATLLNLPAGDLTADKLDLLKKRRIGQLMNQMNSVEFIANHYDDENDGITLFDLPELIAEITINDVKESLNHLIQPNTLTHVYMDPLTAEDYQ